MARDPSDANTLFRLGALDAVEGRRELAIPRLRAAVELNPGDALIRQTLRRAQAGRPLPLAEIDRILTEQLCALFGRTAETLFCPRER
jgi:hypothetical protein